MRGFARLSILVAAIASSHCANSSDGKGGSGGGDGGGGCACEQGHRCIAGACVAVPDFYIYIDEDGYEVQSQSAGAWAYHLAGGYDGGSWLDRKMVLARSGGCTSYRTDPPPEYYSPWEPYCASGGDITIAGGSTPVTLKNQCAMKQSYTGYSMPYFSGGSTLHLTSAGGSDFPPLDLDLPTVQTLDFRRPTVTVGAPATISWTAGAGPAFDIILTGDSMDGKRSVTIVCAAKDTGSFTVPAEVTATLISGGTGMAYVTRRRSLHYEPAGTQGVVDVYLASARRYEMHY